MDGGAGREGGTDGGFCTPNGDRPLVAVLVPVVVGLGPGGPTTTGDCWAATCWAEDVGNCMRFTEAAGDVPGNEPKCCICVVPETTKSSEYLFIKT